MDIKDILRDKGRTVFTVRPDEKVSSLLRVLKRHNVGAVVVCAQFGEVLGIVSERDVVRRLTDEGADVLEREVHEIMTYRAVSCRDTDSVRDAMDKMHDHGVRHLPVVDERGGLAGMVSIRDLIRVQAAVEGLPRAGVPHDFAAATA